MAYVEHNPVTTLWHGQVGGHQYRVVRGRQVITSAISKMRNPNTKKQKRTRERFTQATQFTGLWLPVLKANLMKVENDAFKVRTIICSSAMMSQTVVGGKLKGVDMNLFERVFNEKSGRHVSTELRMVFNETEHKIGAATGEVVVYQIVGFDEKGVMRSMKTEVFVSDGEMRDVVLPVDRKGEVRKYEIIAFNVTLCNGAEWKGPEGEVNGEVTKKKKEGNYYKLLEGLGKKDCRIHGIVGECLNA